MEGGAGGGGTSGQAKGAGYYPRIEKINDNKRTLSKSDGRDGGKSGWESKGVEDCSQSICLDDAGGLVNGIILSEKR